MPQRGSDVTGPTHKGSRGPIIAHTIAILRGRRGPCGDVEGAAQNVDRDAGFRDYWDQTDQDRIEIDRFREIVRLIEGDAKRPTPA